MSIYKPKISLYKIKFDGNHCFIRKCYNIAQQNTVYGHGCGVVDSLDLPTKFPMLIAATNISFFGRSM